jgi:Zn-finger nucleic acid-binding protein
LIACSSCHRQFDVSALAVGAKVRCLCGEVNVVPEIEVRDMVMSRCDSCGGELASGMKECGYCGAGVTMAERGYGGSCPSCYCRLAKGAKFCSSCGTPIELAGTLQPLHDSPCPRCDGKLALQEFDGGALTECTDCGGIWLEESEFENVTDDREAAAVTNFVKGRSTRVERASTPESSVRYLKCPTCQQMMNRKNFASASGVIIDWCQGHGYWFDCHELERIVTFIDEGGLQYAEEMEQERERAGAWRENTRPGGADSLPIAELGGVDLHLRRRREGDDLLGLLSGLLGRLFR